MRSIKEVLLKEIDVPKLKESLIKDIKASLLKDIGVSNIKDMVSGKQNVEASTLLEIEIHTNEKINLPAYRYGLTESFYRRSSGNILYL